MNFQFDESKTFDENLEDFFAFLDQVDASFAQILRTQRVCLLAATEDDTRRSARSTLAAAACAVLDAKPPAGGP